MQDTDAGENEEKKISLQFNARDTTRMQRISDLIQIEARKTQSSERDTAIKGGRFSNSTNNLFGNLEQHRATSARPSNKFEYSPKERKTE